MSLACHCCSSPARCSAAVLTEIPCAFVQGRSRQKHRLPHGGDPITVAFSFRERCPARGSASARGSICHCPSDSALRANSKATARRGAMSPNSCLQGCATAMETILRTINNQFGKFFCCSVKENIVTHFSHCCTSQERSYSEEQVVLPSGLSPAQTPCALGRSAGRWPAVVAQHGPGWEASGGYKAGQVRRHQLAGLPDLLLPSPPPPEHKDAACSSLSSAHGDLQTFYFCKSPP